MARAAEGASIRARPELGEDRVCRVDTAGVREVPGKEARTKSVTGGTGETGELLIVPGETGRAEGTGVGSGRLGRMRANVGGDREKLGR